MRNTIHRKLGLFQITFKIEKKDGDGIFWQGVMGRSH